MLNDNKKQIFFWKPWFPSHTLTKSLLYTLMYNDQIINTIEDTLRTFFNCNDAIIMPSGTSAIYSTLSSVLDSRAGEILLPSNVCDSVASAVLGAGKKLNFLEINPSTYNIDETLIENKIFNTTQALIAVHQSGLPCNISEIRKISEKNNILLIEDAAQAFGAKHKERYVGTWGDVGILSFNNKVFDACGGGAILTNKSDISKKIRNFRDGHFKITRKNTVKKYIRSLLLSKYPGIAYKLKKKSEKNDCINEEIDLFSLYLIKEIIPYIFFILKKRKEIFDYYNSSILNDEIKKPLNFNDNNVSSCYVYTLQLQNNKLNRDILLRDLYSNEIFVEVLSNSIHHKYNFPDEFPLTDKLFHESLSLPTTPNLSLDELEYISSTLNIILNKYG